MKDLFILYSGKCYGDTFYYAIKESTNIYGEKLYYFGKVYHTGLFSHFDSQGFCSYKTKIDALKACIKFSGKKLSFNQLKKLYHGKSLVTELYYIKVTTNKSISVTPDLYTGRNAINSFNEFFDSWKTLHAHGYKSIELYKIGCTLPKRILI